MGDTAETKQQDTAAPPAKSGIEKSGIDWDAQPASLTTREVAALLGKSPGNVRRPAPPKATSGRRHPGRTACPATTATGSGSSGERMAARQAQAAALSAPPDPPLAVLLTALQAQQTEQVALYKTWVEEAREAGRLAKEEAKELRAALHDREETTRETLTHMDMLHEQSVAQMKEALERERVQWEREFAAKDAEIERLKAVAIPEKVRPQLWRK